jgi:hypothetical protein
MMCLFKRKGSGISLLVPFTSDSPRRTQTWEWLQRYWKNELPGAQIIVAGNDHVPFCKTAAVNTAWRRARGDVIVILDADCYLPGSVIASCAQQIMNVEKNGGRLWYIPYRHFYRLTDEASNRVLKSNPRKPLRFSDPPPLDDIEESRDSGYGHWFGALIQVMPRQAFILAGGMDERFVGWGGEDISFMTAVDTLYANHRTTSNGVLHLWHPHTGTEHFERQWAGQTTLRANDGLSQRYADARGRRVRMHGLTRETGAGELLSRLKETWRSRRWTSCYGWRTLAC